MRRKLLRDAEGADHDSVEAPAPAFAVTEAVADDGHDGHGGHDAAASTETAASLTNDAGTSWAVWVGLGAGLAGLILGGLAFLRTGRKA